MDKQKVKENEEEEEMEFKASKNQEEEEEKDKIEITDEIERNKVGIMRALVEREELSAKDVDDLTIRRFLRARDLDIEKASTMFLKYLSWRRTFMPRGFISESEISTQLPHNKLFMQGLDKQGRPIVVAFGGRHKPSKGNLEEVKRFVVYGLEKICDSERIMLRFYSIGVSECQKDRKSLWQSEILKDGDTRIVTFVLMWHLYQSCRIAIQRGLPNYLLFMCPTYL
ncbi:hypothetical protein PTKIN_Ptkin10aG0062100 [Pterospermum kingtungense]